MKEIKIKVDYRNQYAFLNQVDKINEQLARYHYPLLTYEIKKVVDKDYIDYLVFSEFNKTNLVDEDVTFMGVVELLQLGQDDTKIFDITNEKVSNILMNEHCTCDKCKKDIARGKYIVFSKTEDVKTRKDLVILGTSCAKAYFPFNITNFLDRFEHFVETLMNFDEDSLGSSSMAARNADLDSIAYATNVITNGLTKPYIKGDTLNEIRDYYELLFSKKEKDRKLADSIRSKVTEMLDTEEMITVAKDYFERHAKENDYYFNCNQFLKYDEIDKKYFGRVASALIFGNLNAKKEKEAIEEKSQVTSYIMEEKEKFKNLELTFDRVISFDTQYGVTSMMKFLDNEGHILVWYTQKSTKEISPSARPLNKGDKVYLNGTCKGHKEYRGEKQTLITRCKSAVEPKFVPTAEEIEASKQANKDLEAMYSFFDTMNGNC